LVAFVQLESFAIPRSTSWWQDSDRIPVWPVIAWPAWLEFSVRRMAAAGLSILIIATLCWMLLDRLSGPGIGRSGAGGSGLKMFTVSTAPPAEVSVSKAVTPPQPSAATADVDVSKPADLPIEWSVAKVRVAKEAGASAVVQPPILAGGGAVAGGGGGYDPYAGASPHRNDVPAAGLAYAAGLAPGGANAGAGQPTTITLDPGLIDAAKRAALRVQPGARGRVLLSVRLSASGAIMEVRPERSELEQAPLHALMRALLGARVRAAGDSAALRLPEIIVG
jgi:hypothetical protein